MLKKILNYVTSFGLDSNKLAQMGHFLGGYAFSVTGGLIGTGLILGPWGITKEFYYDVRPPENATYLNGLLDYSFYSAGTVVGLLTRVYFLHLGWSGIPKH